LGFISILRGKIMKYKNGEVILDIEEAEIFYDSIIDTIDIFSELKVLHDNDRKYLKDLRTIRDQLYTILYKPKENI
jgi:hypothetical protein